MLRFLRRPSGEKRLLLKTVIVLCVVRLALWLIPFRMLRRLLQRGKRRAVAPDRPETLSVDRIAWAVRLCSRCLPAFTCLTQALAAQLLLKHTGHQAHLRIGVAKGKDGRLEAHAWVESDGRIVVGDMTGLSRFTVLSSHREELS